MKISILNAKGHFKSRSYDEILITIYTNSKNNTGPDEIFRQWFEMNNEILQQESFAFEYNNALFIEKLF